jgi:hypothetical protein
MGPFNESLGLEAIEKDRIGKPRKRYVQVFLPVVGRLRSFANDQPERSALRLRQIA